MPKLENWNIIANISNFFQPPENAGICLQGEIYDDENNRFSDGTDIRTSSIQYFDSKTRECKTKNTLYHLGFMSEDFKKFLERDNYSLKDYDFDKR